MTVTKETPIQSLVDSFTKLDEITSQSTTLILGPFLLQQARLNHIISVVKC